MTLSITIDSDVTIGETGQLLDVHFVFGDEYEKCSLPLSFWSLADYVSQWISAISHVVEVGSPAALITSIHDPAIFVNLVAWILYPLKDGSVRIQQHFLMHNQFVKDGKLIGYESLRPRKVISLDGAPISEWTVSINDLILARNELRHLENKIP